jgi:UTP:GlnB (protein PII) uridylyltransferase
MNSPEFEVSLAKETAKAYARRSVVFESLSIKAHAKLKDDMCLLVRGSLARGDFCSYSDVDLILLVSDEKNRGLDITQLLRSKVPYAVSLQTWLPSTPSEKLGSLHTWFSVSQCCYLAGDAELFVACHTSWLALLTRLDGNFLCEIYDSDPKRHQGMRDKASPLSYNVKRGRGGIVDYEFSNLVSLWLKLKNRHSPLQLSLINLSQHCFQYLFLLKSYLHTVFQCSCESSVRLFEHEGMDADVPYIFSRKHIVEMQERHSEAIEALKRTLTGD